MVADPSDLLFICLNFSESPFPLLETDEVIISTSNDEAEVFARLLAANFTQADLPSVVAAASAFIEG